MTQVRLVHAGDLSTRDAHALEWQVGEINERHQEIAVAGDRVIGSWTYSVEWYRRRARIQSGRTDVTPRFQRKGVASRLWFAGIARWSPDRIQATIATDEGRDFFAIERDNAGDPSGKLHDFVQALQIVIDQLDRQRRRANWHEAAHPAGKQKLIESAVAKALEAARAAAHVYAERVDALGLAADDNDPLVMATAEPVGAAQADLFAALGLLVRDASGKASAVDPPETVEQLRAERDTARTLAEVRARDIPEQIADFVAKEGYDNCDGGWGRLYAERIRAGKWRTP